MVPMAAATTRARTLGPWCTDTAKKLPVAAFMVVPRSWDRECWWANSYAGLDAGGVAVEPCRGSGSPCRSSSSSVRVSVFPRGRHRRRSLSGPPTIDKPTHRRAGSEVQLRPVEKALEARLRPHGIETVVDAEIGDPGGLLL